MATVHTISQRLNRETDYYKNYGRPPVETTAVAQVKPVTQFNPRNGALVQLPNRKVGSAAVAGAITAILVFVLGRYGIEFDGDVSAAITTLVTLFVGYFVPLPAEEQPAE